MHPVRFYLGWKMNSISTLGNRQNFIKLLFDFKHLKVKFLLFYKLICMLYDTFSFLSCRNEKCLRIKKKHINFYLENLKTNNKIFTNQDLLCLAYIELISTYCYEEIILVYEI